MGSAAAWLLLAAAIVTALSCTLGWYLLRRPARLIERRRREQALAAAAHYTPAPRSSPYGAVSPATDAPAAAAAAAPLSDPCAPGLSDNERVDAMRKLLLRGQPRPAASVSELLAAGDEQLTTSPMAWNPTLPPDEAELIDARRPSSRPRVRDADHEHITLI